MSKKILFSDLDGTLYIHGVVSDADREAIRRWRADGNLFAMASGRHLSALKQHLTEQGVEWDYLICLNGGEIYDAEDNLLYESAIDISILPALFETVARDDGWANICCGMRADRVKAKNCTDYNTDHAHYDVSHLSTFTKFSQICTARKDISVGSAIKRDVLEKFGDYVCAELNGTSLDVDAKGVSKSNGIAELIRRIGISEDCVYTVGDNFNDLSMLTAYQGYAMEHGPEEVRRKTGRCISSVAALIDLLSE
jgi:Cof subfamily protein (haloacid dehalogenase superfamily)